ncbi:hypothetical protein J1605_016577 [Eschrichtius robustus]|uniref:Uncharacterized protein n=1 Tax=Eschrichtius robustus TaxID=9764 RepID=A0AB34I5K5_ESCRO|nr:hypothetical protein J1605_016577 [Eschrichtius robustus]
MLRGVCLLSPGFCGLCGP